MASPKMMISIPILFIIILIISSYGPLFVRGKYLEECERSSSAAGQDLYSLHCRLRTMNSEFDFKTRNFSGILSGDSVVSLHLQCSDDVLLNESSLQPGVFAHFSRLSSLHIEHCKVSRLPPSVFAGLSILRNLIIRTHYKTASSPSLSLELSTGVFSHLPHLEKLDISANNIRTLPDRLFFCPASSSLVTLNVSLSRLQDISDLGFRDRGDDDKETNGGGCSLGIQILDLSYNRLTRLPSRGLGTLSSLRELYLQGNEISGVSDRPLAGLKGLRVLNLAHNKIAALPESLLADTTEEITEIYLQNNSLSSLPPKLLAKCNQLLVLDLSHNILTSSAVSSKSSKGIKGIFSGLIRLVLLNLGYNRLSRLSPEPFQDLHSIQILNLEHNFIESIEPNSFSAMTNLQSLILSHNKLSFIDDTT